MIDKSLLNDKILTLQQKVKFPIYNNLEIQEINPSSNYYEISYDGSEYNEYLKIYTIKISLFLKIKNPIIEDINNFRDEINLIRKESLLIITSIDLSNLSCNGFYFLSKSKLEEKI